MNLEKAIDAVRSSARRMNELYGRTVFDEWAIVSLLPNQGRVLDYSGPRANEFAASFKKDLATLRTSLLKGEHQFGDHEFARHGQGSQFDAYMCIGEGVYLMCNNLYTTMDEITKDPRWLGAQVPFVELSELFHSSPVTYTA
ncbi:MAG TPA: hypothetical protein DCY13_00535 [Verrucomicrobiales bacterium]|nr:hypothetical protein [Verrucomicrobiales bacterium]